MKCIDGLDFLINKYDVSTEKYELLDNKIKMGDNTIIPLMSWRNERRFIELKNLTVNGTMGKISVIRICNINYIDTDINNLIYRELDLCEFFGNSEIVSIFAVINNRTANIIAKLANDIVCTVEVAATLSKESEPIDKHEIITQRGICCDKVVDTQIPQKSIYVFNNNPKSYLDTDFELFGLDTNEVALVRCGFEALKDKTYADKLINRDIYLKKIVDLTLKSAQTLKNILVEDEI